MSDPRRDKEALLRPDRVTDQDEEKEHKEDVPLSFLDKIGRRLQGW